MVHKVLQFCESMVAPDVDVGKFTKIVPFFAFLQIPCRICRRVWKRAERTRSSHSSFVISRLGTASQRPHMTFTIPHLSFATIS
jgi:hypothetical protein